MKEKSLLKIGFTAVCMLLAVFVTNLQTAPAQLCCQIAGTPVTTTGSLATGDATQTSRIFRDGISRGCGTFTAPTAAPIAGTYQFDQHSFTNTTGQAACITVEYNFTGCGANSTQMNAYLGTFNPANITQNLIGTGGFSSVGSGVMTLSVAAGATYVLVVHEVAANSGCASYTFTTTTRTGCRQPGFDRNNDSSAEYAVYRPAALSQWINGSTGGTETRQFAASGDVPTHGDYTGDGVTDLAVYRPSNNTGYYALSQTTPTTSFATVPWGSTGDVPVPGDFDRDGKHDVTVWRPSNGTWYSLRSTNNTLLSYPWGANGDTPVSGDFDGDLITDFGVVRTVGSNLVWQVLQSNFNYGFAMGCPSTAPFCGGGIAFGSPGDKLVPGDFNGDGKADIAVWRPSDGTYYIRTSTGTNLAAPTRGIQWGVNGDIPQPADYNGDEINDFAVFRPSNNFFYVLQSGSNAFASAQIGQSGDEPVTAPYRIQ